MLCDGQKPVQRRILYAMSRMGLGFGGPTANTGAKPVKSARVWAMCWAAFTRTATRPPMTRWCAWRRTFSQRYPLIDGQGNFGSRDGDGAAAMRYTEARLAKITSLLLDEIDQGTVDFSPQLRRLHRVSREQLPARLPFTLLNGASGIAVGLADRNPQPQPARGGRCLRGADQVAASSPMTSCCALVPGPDFPAAARSSAPATDIAEAYRSGRGSLKVPGALEDRGAWRAASGSWSVTELPPGVSTQRVLEEIEELTNPKVKAGKKALVAGPDPAQGQHARRCWTWCAMSPARTRRCGWSSSPRPVRIDQQELITTPAGPHQPGNLVTRSTCTMVGLDGRPTQKSLRQMLLEWIDFRQTTIERRSRHRLGKVLRPHPHPGRAADWCCSTSTR